MAAVTPAGRPGAVLRDDVWIAVDENSAVSTARRRAAALATECGLDADRVEEVAIVASELATNVVKHAGGGDLVLRPLPGTGIQVVAIDRGPGTRDLEALIDDGVSTAGTLGVGLGAVRRLATRVDLWSAPARGAVVVAELGPDHPEPAAPGRGRPGHLVRTLRGESVCGDTIAYRSTAAGWLLLVADGLGHGQLAAEASRRAADILATAGSESPGELVQRMHSGLSGTRGAAVAVSNVDLAAGVLTHAAVGNITGRLLEPHGRARSMVSQPGIVGHKLPRVRETQHDLDQASLVVLHSDGLTEKWSGTSVPPVAHHGATVCAAALLRDAGTRRDDASVLTLQVLP